MRALRLPLLAVLLAGGCDDLGTDPVSDTLILTVSNDTSARFVSYQYSLCGADSWTEVLASDEVVSPGGYGESNPVQPGCYDLYIEDEVGCYASKSTGDLDGGQEYIWSVNSSNLDC